MPISLPRLDDRTWDDLVTESLERIPVYAPEWTNHNAADPGITILELFAYVAENLIYRIDQISDSQKLAFLRLINGPGWAAGGDLAEDIRCTLADLTRPHRAVTPADYEAIVTAQCSASVDGGPVVRVGRAHCLSRLDLAVAGSRVRAAQAPGHVSVVIVPDPVDAETEELVHQVRRTLNKVRLVATRVHVAPARYLKIGVRLLIIADHRFTVPVVKENVLGSLSEFFDPLKGGSEGTGWPFGRNVYVSEVYQRLINVPGIVAVHRTRQPGTSRATDELMFDASDSGRVKRNRSGEIEALELQPFELVRFERGSSDITVTHDLSGEASGQPDGKDGVASIN